MSYYLLEQSADDAVRADVAGGIGLNALRYLSFCRRKKAGLDTVDDIVMYALARSAAHVAGVIVNHIHGEFVDSFLCPDCGVDIRITSICADAEERFSHE